MPHITFIHGICNKPAPEELLRDWCVGLGGDDGIEFASERVTTSMVYWADVLYPEPLATAVATESYESSALQAALDPIPMHWRGDLKGAERDWVEGLAQRIRLDANVPDDIAPPVREHTDASYERIPLPGFVKKRLMDRWLRDVHHYLFNVAFSPRPGATFVVRDEIRRRFVETLRRDAGLETANPHIVVSHSMGTVIAYDCLKRVAECPPVDALITVGSPLGLDEVQDRLRPEAPGGVGWSRDDGFPAAAHLVQGKWMNVYDPLDPVAGFDPHLANDYRRSGQPVIEDVPVTNIGAWRHDIAKYLLQAKLRSGLRSLLGLAAATA